MGHFELNACKSVPKGYLADLRANDPRNSGMFERIRGLGANGRLGSTGPPKHLSTSSNGRSVDGSPHLGIQEAARKLFIS